ncbi:MAG: alanine racemase [Gaiellales bacterium]
MRGPRSLVAIDLAAVASNVRRLVAAADGAEVWAVVKADGYGHGAVDVGRAALDAGAARLCVATVGEARLVRAALPGAALIVLSPLGPGEEAEAEAIGCAAVVSTPEGWERARTRHGLDVHVKVDTGMGRWGLAPDHALAAGRELAAGPRPERLHGLMSHLATADGEDRAFVDRQAAAFADLAAAFPPCVRHLANSAAALRYPDLAWDAVRPGLAVYGMDPLHADASAWGLAPALRWTSAVASVRALGPGDSSGYGRRLVADRPCRVALVPIGYADGYPRVLSGRADALIGGRRCPVAATVSMDQLAALIPDDLEVEEGDEVVLVGGQGGERITAEELARAAGTIAYEITCGVRSAPARAQREVR